MMELTPIEKAREAFLNMIADAESWECDVDGDIDNNGRTVCYVTYSLVSSHHAMEEFLESIGIEPKRDESFFDAVNRMADEPPLMKGD